MRRVILESPFGAATDAGVAENVVYARRCVADCVKRGEAPIASHLLFTQPGVLDDRVPEQRKLGIAAGHAWIRIADAMVVYLDRGCSAGMVTGIDIARAAGVPIEQRYLDGPVTAERNTAR